MSPWILNVQESGERHLFQMLSQCYPSNRGSVGLPAPKGMTAFKGMNGQPGSGAYLLDWDGKSCGDEKVLSKYRALDMGRVVWNHTLQMFAQAEEKVRRDSAALEAHYASIPDPVGWRAG